MSEWNSPGGWNDPARPAAERGSARQASAAPPAATDSLVLEKLVGALTAEQRRSRRWGIFFKFLTFIYLIALLFLFRAPLIGGLDTDRATNHTAVVEVTGA